MLAQNQAPQQIQKVIDLVWSDYDMDKNGYLDVKECKKLVNRIF